MFSDFYNKNNPESKLYDDMIKETVDMFGIPVKYLPQHMIDTNVENILGEDIKTYFDKAIDMKMYLQDYQEFSGAGDLFSKFGLTPDDRLTLIAEQNVIDEILQTNLGSDTVAPQPGDLIYIELLNYFSEVVYVNRKLINFFRFNNIYVYSFVSRRIEYSGQTLNTGISEIDDLANMKQSPEMTDEPIIKQKETEIRDFNKDNPFVNIDNE